MFVSCLFQCGVPFKLFLLLLLFVITDSYSYHSNHKRIRRIVDGVKITAGKNNLCLN